MNGTILKKNPQAHYGANNYVKGPVKMGPVRDEQA